VAIEELGVPGVVLMENAALGVVDAALAEVPDAESAVVFCGPGNNGGDGLAIARHLAVRGLRVIAVIATGGREYLGDARVQYEIACRMKGMGLDLRSLDLESDAASEVHLHADTDLLIDALFGTGMSRPLDGQFSQLVTAINALVVPKVAVDLPSGLNGDQALPQGPHIEADLTVTFAALNIAHVFPPASAAAGEVVIADLGIPLELVERAAGDLYLLGADDLAPLLGPRPAAAHKGDFGHLLVAAGSTGKSGAAVLTAQAAVRAGAGLVTAAVPDTILDAFEAASIETMSTPLPITAAGELGGDALAALEGAAVGMSAVAVGPGLGTTRETAETIRSFCLGVELPLVLDADGLTAFAGRLGWLRDRNGATVLTPHPGELARLLKVETPDIVADRMASVRRAAEESGAIVVLTWHLSLIADPQGGVYVSPTGNPGMATGGSGDVLTGMIGALLAQRMDPLSATQLATFVHGLAGDAVAAEIGEVSLAAGDLLALVPSSFEALAGRKAATVVREAIPDDRDGGAPV
jgi:NAD(P)H-hydrate epimerase